VTCPSNFGRMFPPFAVSPPAPPMGWSGDRAGPPPPRNFNVDNVRIAKLEGCSVGDSALVHGFVIARDTEGSVKELRAPPWARPTPPSGVVVTGAVVSRAAMPRGSLVDVRRGPKMRGGPNAPNYATKNRRPKTKRSWNHAHHSAWVGSK